MENLYAMNCDKFTAELASKAPVPGGGGASAMCGALAASLCAMAGNLTAGKKKYAAYENDIQRMLTDCENLRLRFLELINEDASAFEPLSRAYSKSKDDPDYTAVMREATLAAAAVPYEIMKCCCTAIELLEEMAEKCSVLMVSDVGCGAAIADAALKAAALNVLVNTRTLPNDIDAQTMEQGAERMLSEYSARAEKITVDITDKLRRKNNG